ncbi:MAG: hypothetical protein RL364_773 [Pseudomonadota bacterium]|jgi:4-amino-4-deoxy-L-arabinose transferase-like glycosyltransferase
MSLPEALQPPAPRTAAWLATLAAGLLVLLLVGLWRAPLFDVDEGAFAEATREMLVSGDWGHTTLNGADRFDKPIGVYWLQAISASIFGLHEGAMRLPSALATWLAACAVAGFVGTRWGWRAGALAAVVHVTSFGTWVMAHAATADAVLGLCLMLSALDLWRYLETQDRAALHRLALWVGLGLLVKGPVAVLIPAAALLLSCLSEHRWRLLWRVLSDVRAWLLMLLVAAPWYVYAYMRHGQAFIDGFILRHNLERFAAPMEGHSGGWLYFVLIAPLLWMPWSPLLLAWWGRAALLWQEARTRRALLWALFVFVFFSVSGTKLPHYGLYAAPGVVVLLAAALSYVRAAVWWACAGLLLVWHALLVGLPLVWIHWPTLVPVPLTAAVSHTPARLSLPLVLSLWAWLSLALAIWRRRQCALSGQAVLSVMALLHAVVLTLMVWPWWAQTLQGPIKALGLKARDWSGPVAQAGGNWPSFAFYRQQAMVPGVPQAQWVLTPAQSVTLPADVAARERGMLLRTQPGQERP